MCVNYKTHFKGGCVGPSTVWTGEILVRTGIRSRTIQPVAQSLYRLSYPVHIYIKGKGKVIPLQARCGLYRCG